MKDSEKSDFSVRLRNVRQMKSKTQTECAKALSVTAVAYGAWERGDREPSIEKIVQICRYFNISSDWLLGVKVDSEQEMADLAKYNEEIEKYHALRDKLQEIIGGTK